jgi:DNA-directed RNA polymerase sigma subunit (sigma70/sigma32)
MSNPRESDPLNVYLREVRGVPPLKDGEETDLFRQVRNHGDQKESALKRLVEANLHLVPPIAERHASATFSVLDLIQEGNNGLLSAVRTFPGGSESFSAYAVTRIEDAIAKAMAESRSASE